jgi:uncharacterized membrane protein
MHDVFYALAAMDQFSVVVSVSFVLVAFWLIRLFTNSTALAVISSPVLLVGGLAANYLFHARFVMPVDDKDTNVVIASAVGVVIALVLLLLSIWISVMMSERRGNARKLMQLEDLPPSRNQVR